MIVLHNISYRGCRCRQLYSKDDGKTWCLDWACEVVANPLYIRSI